MVNWEREARILLALFRMESGLHLDDPWFTTLIAQLQLVSTEFRLWWSSMKCSSSASCRSSFSILISGS